MMPHYRPLCDCCGQPVDLARGDICPRCGYPVLPEKEERFLVTAIQDLRRVADHGGNLLSVGQLLGRYQARLAVLRQFTAAATLPTPVLVAPPPPAASMAPVRTPEVPAATLRQPQVPVPPPPVPPQPAGPVFSFRSFFEDQFINIVASLGAFLILVGSLSFVATQTNLLLSFLIMFAVHAVFGGIGIIARRFPGFRIVAGIYTAIFALLLPLVGWAAYRLVAARFLPISTPSLIAITAIYATLAYASLAIYQRFVPFGFLAGVSLIVADLATASSWHLAYWWWPVALLLLAFPLLASVSGRFPDALAILRSPARAIMFTCVGAGAGGLLLIGLYTLLFMNSTSFELRLTLASLALLLLAWFSLFAWLRRDHRWARVLSYFFLLSVLTCAYASNFSAQGYALACVATAWLFHLLDRYIQRSLPVL
ncbi:MAG: hypothetical protein J2P36_23870, partial [Ktedonobacteraceae bacterium]|nr:hypothetical protein [Ktedonobacteraceae bacterium]